MKRMRSSILLLALITLLGLHGSANAQNRTIRLVVPFPPGTTTDVVARILSQELKDVMGAPIIVENKAGASGMIGAESVARAEPDGSTFLMTTAATHSVNPWLFKTLSYDPLRQFVHISHLVDAPLVVSVNADLPIRSMSDLVAHAARKPGELIYGYGTPTHQAATLAILNRNKLDLLAVPYKGSSPAVLAASTGEVQLVLSDIISAMPLIQSGKLRAIAISRKSSLLPNLDILTEIGYPEFNMVIWVGLAGPTGTKPEVAKLLSTGVLKVLSKPEVRERISALGLEVAATPNEDVEAFVSTQLSVWGERIRNAGITPE
jgi:tripartite-type tricarboxylate transporter receptor subunit TctC